MANTDRGRKLLIRSALATSATIATLTGAQSLALLDVRSFAAPDPVSNTPSPMVARAAIPVLTVNRPAAPQLAIRQAAPSLVILRPATIGTDDAAAASPTSLPSVIQPHSTSGVTRAALVPPAPVMAAAPPVVLQQPIPQSSRSTR